MRNRIIYGKLYNFDKINRKKVKLIVFRSLIFEIRFLIFNFWKFLGSRFESSFEMLEVIRECIKIIWEFIELSCEIFEWEK